MLAMAHQSPMPKSKAVTIPLVILNGIFRQLQPGASTDRPFDLSGPGDIENRKSLCAAILVCRRWFAPAKAALYRQVSPCLAKDPVAHHRYVSALITSQALARPDVTKSIHSLSLAPFKNSNLLGGIVPLLHTLYEHFRNLTRLELPPAQMTLLQPRGLSTVRFMHMKTLILGASPAGDPHTYNVPALAELFTILEHFPRLHNLSLGSEVPLPSHDGYALHDLPLTKTLRHLQINTNADYPHDLLQQLAHLPALRTLEVCNTGQWEYEVVDLSWADTCTMPNVETVEICTRVPGLMRNVASISNFVKLRKLKLALAVYNGVNLVQDLRSFPESIEELSFSRLGPDVLMIVEAILHAVPVWLPELRFGGLDADCLGLEGREGRGALRMTLESLFAIRHELDLREVEHDLACIAVLDERLGDDE